MLNYLNVTVIPFSRLQVYSRCNEDICCRRSTEVERKSCRHWGLCFSKLIFTYVIKQPAHDANESRSACYQADTKREWMWNVMGRWKMKDTNRLMNKHFDQRKQECLVRKQKYLNAFLDGYLNIRSFNRALNSMFVCWSRGHEVNFASRQNKKKIDVGFQADPA